MTVTLCLFCSLRCSTRGLGVHSIGAFPRAPSVGCGLPYHIWSLLSGSLLATASGISDVPRGLVWSSLPHLVSNSLGVCWQLHRGFPRPPPSVRCGLPYHIWSLLSGSLLATASGISEVPLGRVWLSLPHLVSNSLGVCWQLHRGFPRSPSVGWGLPYHISSLTLWESVGNCSGTQTQLS